MKRKRKKLNRLFEAYPTQYCGNLRARRPWVRCRSPGRLKCDSLLEIESPGRSRRDDLLGPLGLAIPKRLRPDNLSRTRSLGRSRRDDLLGPPGWSLGIPKVSSMTQCWVELRVCNSLLVCPLWMGIDAMM